MRIPLTTVELMEAFCKLTGRYAMYVSISIPDDIAGSVGYAELFKAAPYMREDELRQIVVDEQGVILFDREDQMEYYYALTIGDDGPTSVNSYNGKVRVYALTCGPEGLRNENT